MGSRERLIEAMSDLMWERGYAATSPRDVLERAGVGQGSMYHYFKGKHEFAAETLARVAAEIEGQAVPVDGDDSPLDRLKQHLLQPRPGTRGCRIGRMTQDPDVFADAELIGIIDGTFRSVLERWERVIEEAIAVGELPESIVAADLARTFASVLQGGYVLARAERSQDPMDAAVRGAVQLLDAVAVRDGSKPS